MRALVYRGPWVMAEEDLAATEPAASEVVIAVIATGICGSDFHGYSGSTGRRSEGQVMGHELVGRVAAIGSDVDDLVVGTLVTANPLLSCRSCDACRAGAEQACELQRVLGVDPTLPGSMAATVTVPGDRVVSIEGLADPLHGALVEPLAVGYHALLRGRPRITDRLLVIGGGTIGQAVAVAARRVGVEQILVSEPALECRAVLGALGFAAVTPDQVGAALDSVLGGPATLVVDAVGIDASAAASVANSARQARIVLVGMGTQQIEFPSYGISAGEREVLGSYCYSDRDFADTADWVRQGHPELGVMVLDTVDFADGPDAFHRLAVGELRGGKVLLRS